MMSRSLLIAGACLFAAAVTAGCVAAPYHGAYRYDDRQHFDGKRYHDDHDRRDWSDDRRWRRHRHHH